MRQEAVLRRVPPACRIVWRICEEFVTASHTTQLSATCFFPLCVSALALYAQSGTYRPLALDPEGNLRNLTLFPR